MAKTNIAALLAKSATKTNKKKSDTPELDLHTDDNITCQCGTVNSPSAGGWKCTSCDAPLSLTDRVYMAYQQMHDAKAVFDSLESQLLEKVCVEYEDGAKNDFHKTYNVAGKETPGVQVSYKDQFKSIPIEKATALKAAMGSEEKYNQYFYQKRELSLLDTSDTTIELILGQLGEELFTKLFKVELGIGTCPDMDRKQFSLPVAVRMAVIQYKPATKARKED